MTQISKNKMVSLKYILRYDDANGELIEQTNEDSPLSFLYGAGLMLPKFEEHLAGLKQGDKFQISLDAVDAYGEVEDEAIVDLPKEVFFVDGVFDDEIVFEGNTVPMVSSEGQRLEGTIVKVGETTVQVDFNHPLAGETLFFTGEILEVREATDKEIVDATMGHNCGCEGGCDCGDSEGKDSCCGSSNNGGCCC
ncbi:MAG: FKBP-type peptidyl-prolyl cis-trans isomerase [Bacteroidota bacterium]|nr:FKBP-type peptidyl-prolyl cis-trans isomerase [Bacteroidota bacterium]MDP4205038.1 FKBP-type peptidyl-prolyl cis-trans isomerase [Bacteroidota bacterium]